MFRKFHTLPKLKNGQILGTGSEGSRALFQKKGGECSNSKMEMGQRGYFLMTETLSKQIEGREQGLIS